MRRHRRRDDQREEQEPKHELELPERQGEYDDSERDEGDDGGPPSSVEHRLAMPAKSDR